jgi:hypothetical protein
MKNNITMKTTNALHVRAKNFSPLLLLLLAVGCDKIGDPDNGLTSGYRVFSAAFHTTETNPQDYRVEMWGKDLKLIHYSGSIISNVQFPYAETDGTLKVYYQKDTVPQLSTTYNVLERGTTIELVKTPGEPVALYDPDRHAIISLVMVLNDGYRAAFNGQELVTGNNYFRKDDFTRRDVDGRIVYYNEAGELASVGDVIAMTPENPLLLLQTSDTDFLTLNGGDTGDDPPVEPADYYHMGIRFIWLPPADFPRQEDVRLEVSVEPQSATQESYAVIVGTYPPNSLTRYVELTFYYTANGSGGINTETYYTLNVYNPDTDELLASYVLYNRETTNSGLLMGLPNINPTGNPRRFSNKMQTWLVPNNRGRPERVPSLIVPW